MKNFYALFISGLITFCFSANIQAQSTHEDLDQVELMKQFVGSWIAETSEDNTVLWEIVPVDRAYEQSFYYKEKGVTKQTSKGIIAFTLLFQKVVMYSTSPEGTLWHNVGKFVSDKKMTGEMFYADQPNAEGTWEVSFLTPDKFNWIVTWEHGELDTTTYIRNEEAVDDQDTQRAPATLQKFDNIDEWMKAIGDPERDIIQKPEEVLKNINLKPGDVVADIGADRGYFTQYFVKAVSPGGRALGLDINPASVHLMMINAAMLKSNVYETRLIKPDNPELELGSVNVAFLCATYPLIENRVDYFKRLLMSLKKNGRVVIVDWHKKKLPEGFTPNFPILSKDVVIEEFREAGYKLTHDKDFLQYQYYLEFGY